MSKDRRVFVGNVAFTFTRGLKSVTFTLQARLEIERQIAGTTASPRETWQATASRRIVATSGFETREFADEPLVFPCHADMRAGTEVWHAALVKMLLHEDYLKALQKRYRRKLRAKQASFQRGQIWEETV